MPYVVYNEEQLRERQQDAVTAVAGVLSISDAEVVRVLRQFKWYVHEALHIVFMLSSGQGMICWCAMIPWHIAYSATA